MRFFSSHMCADELRHLRRIENFTNADDENNTKNYVRTSQRLSFSLVLGQLLHCGLVFLLVGVDFLF